jgi:hypothetical protein
MTTPDSRFHATATDLAAHLAAFGELAEADQRRHLRAAHHVGDPEVDLDMLARAEGRPVTYSDAHEWWHIRQRRSLSIGGALDADRDQGWP